MDKQPIKCIFNINKEKELEFIKDKRLVLNKSSLILLMFLIFNNVIFAQQDSIVKKNTTFVNVDLVSRYIWRGSNLGASPSIQPKIEYRKSGIKIGMWGAYAINYRGYQESDLYLGYTYKKRFSVTITDYYFQIDSIHANYFNYKEGATKHVFEAALSFKGTKKLPLSLMIATNVYGADAKRANGKNQISTYAEMTYTFKHFVFFVGADLTPVDLTKGETGYYGNAVGFVNIGITATKKIKITDNYSLPLTCSLITNPQAEKIYLVAELSF